MRHAFALALAAGILAAPIVHAQYQPSISPEAKGGFVVVPEVSDQAGAAPIVDPDLVNPWGISASPSGTLWTSNNHSSTSTLYNHSTFAKAALTVRIPAATGPDGAPTGTVYVPGSGFVISKGANSGHAIFLFDGEDGSITGWNPNVDANAVVAVDLSGEDAVFKGLALGAYKGAQRLFAADFHNNRVIMYDDTFTKVGEFTDPTLPRNYAPFNVQMLGNKLFVAFALRQKKGDDERDGPGWGYVDVFDTNGRLMSHLISGGKLNAPWGMIKAPAAFGASLAGALLVGNFGDGRINAYNPDTGDFIATLSDSGGNPIVIDGLWALFPGPDKDVIFSAGPDGEDHGLLGKIQRGRVK